jgi:hypothetical protein
LGQKKGTKIELGHLLAIREKEIKKKKTGEKNATQFGPFS